VYAAITHYLKAVQAGKTDDGTKVIAKMKELPTDDPLRCSARARCARTAESFIPLILSR